MILGFEKLGATINKDAKKVVVLHDWLSDHSSYKPSIPYLNKKNYQYAFIDLRGYGLSKDKTGQYTLAETAQDIIDTIDLLGWSQFHLVGHSMTALVGQLICALVKQRVQSFIAVTPVGAVGTPDVSDEMSGFMKAAATDNDEFAAQAVHMMTDNRYGKNWSDFKVKAWRETSTPKARVGYMYMFLNSNILEEVQGIETPMCIICGTGDSEGYRKNVMEKTFAKWYPHCEIVEIQNTGHYPMQETPVSFAREIMSFLDKQT